MRISLFLVCYLSIYTVACQSSKIKPDSQELVTTTRVESLEKEATIIQQDSIPVGLKRLMKAYPGQFKEMKKNTIIWADGSEMEYDDGRTDKLFYELMNEPDVEDQVMNMAYPRGIDFPTPVSQSDPGRIRCEPFFKKMYGQSKAEVMKNLTTITWLPKTLGIKLQVTTINNVHLKLQEISNRLDTMPRYHKYLKNPGGTFNWRNIAGTKRLSLHSFGMTIDINVEYSNYWRWAIKGNDPDGKRIIEYRNRIPLELAAIFEEYGFIWGGKWYHYDTMHFEYRPEMFID